MQPPANARERFSNRVEHYLATRPKYPDALYDVLARETGLDADWTIADIGSGTGFLSEVFLRAGNRVFCIEPNEPVRAGGERYLRGKGEFHNVAGSAEATTLGDRSVDLVAAGQAFHWFDAGAARAEWRRILREPGWVALVWNTRRNDGSPFMREYEALLAGLGDYANVRHRHFGDERMEALFGARGWVRHAMPNRQQLDRAGLRGRLLSSSYSPAPGSEAAAAALAKVDALFERHAADGMVELLYETELYVGRVR
ncbi:MAG: Methyltransferase domain protein [candidate division BRC1 bacterium ADurb.BinA292]|nr:MAG: Methyltransferase domain protein [candidate division BRC1 bacterium ADurb.BinA292]